MSELAALQRWFTSIVVRPGRLYDKILAADHTYSIDNTIAVRSSPEVSGVERIQIYARGYVLRLMECLRADYPVLRSLMGEEVFDMFAQAYLGSLPSSSYSLYDLGYHFPDFLEASRPRDNGDTAEQQSQFGLPIELARLERARAEVYRSKGVEGGREHATLDQPVFFMPDATPLAVPPCLRLLHLRYPLAGFVRAVERGEEPPVPALCESMVAISRRNYVAHMQDLEPWQWYFLREFASTGDYVRAVEAASLHSSVPHDAIWADLMLWIPAAISFGYLHKPQ